jgi:AraC-like DNA-binding protein
LLALFTVAQYRKKIKFFFSTVDNIKLSWATIIVWLFIALWGTSMVFFILRIFRYRIFIPGEVSIVLLFIFANLLIYKGLTQPVLFYGKLFNHNNKHYNLSEETANNYLKKLLNFMENEKPYLDNNLTLRDLAEKVSISTRNLSHVINNKLKQNFYDFINKYRVNEAKQLLIDPDFQKYTILGVAFEAGFNSKSTFNLIFKKFEKITPSQFQRNNQKGIIT